MEIERFHDYFRLAIENNYLLTIESVKNKSPTNSFAAT